MTACAAAFRATCAVCSLEYANALIVFSQRDVGGSNGSAQTK